MEHEEEAAAIDVDARAVMVKIYVARATWKLVCAMNEQTVTATVRWETEPCVCVCVCEWVSETWINATSLIYFVVVVCHLIKRHDPVCLSNTKSHSSSAFGAEPAQIHEEETKT